MLAERETNFLLNSSVGFQSVINRISGLYRIEALDQQHGARQYLDTFDWRLYRKGLFFVISEDTGIFETFDGKLMAQIPVVAGERIFQQNLDRAGLPSKFRKHIGVRAVCPVLSLKTIVRTFKILNSERKIVARLAIEQRELEDGTIDADIPELLVISEVRGYDKVFDSITAVLASVNLRGDVAHGELLDIAFAAGGRKPCDYGNKFDIPLEHDISIGAAVKRICLDLASSMDRNLSGICDDIDSEFLHDFRIAVRRTRSLLSLLRPFLPQKETAFYEKEFRWLGSVTGAMRDIDVYLLKEQTYRDMLPPSLKGGLDLFFTQLGERRVSEIDLLRANLASDRFLKLMESWRSFLTADRSPLFSGKGSWLCRPVVDKVISKRYKRFLKDGDAIGGNTPDEELHRLRIKGKKFRYLLEFFKSFYRRDDVEGFLKHMKILQDNLGDFNDLSVQSEMLEEKLEGLRARNRQTIQYAAALGGLISGLKNRLLDTRNDFSKTYRNFRTEENNSIIAGMTTPSSPENRSGGRK